MFFGILCWRFCPTTTKEIYPARAEFAIKNRNKVELKSSEKTTITPMAEAWTRKNTFYAWTFVKQTNEPTWSVRRTETAPHRAIGTFRKYVWLAYYN